jgi:DNA-binding NarL/FixJ family response regulator
MMPGMDGFETLLKIRVSEKGGEIPIIYLTGLELAGYEARALSLGAVDFIRKPVEKDVLLARIALRLAQAKNRLELDVLKENRECLGGLNPEKLLEMAQRLTKTEFAVPKLVAQVYTNEEIGNQLCYSPAYVKKVVSRVFDRLDISRRSEVKRFFT